MVLAAFTGSDWFQLSYPALWFFLGIVVGRRRATHVVAPSGTAISIVRVIEVRVPRPSRKQKHKPQPTTPKTDDDVLGTLFLIFVGLLVAVAVLAYAYIELRTILLAVASALLAASLGLVVGTVWRRVRLGLFAGDWGTASVCIVLLAAAAVGVGYFLLNPVKGPPEYNVLFDAYRQEDFSALTTFDSNVRLFACQAIGAAMLIASSAMLLWASLGCLAKGALVSGASPSRIRVRLAAIARSRGSVLGAFGVVVVLLAGGLFFGAGYVADWSGFDERVDTPQLLAPTVSVNGRNLTVKGVATADGVMSARIRFAATGERRPQSSSRPLRWAIEAGRFEVRGRLPRRRPLRVVLAPARRRGAAGDPVRFACDASPACSRIENDPA
jgi:hypothetical protein